MCKKIESIRKVLSDRRSHRDTEHPYDIAIILYPAGCVKGVFVARDSWLVDASLADCITVVFRHFLKVSFQVGARTVASLSFL